MRRLLTAALLAAACLPPTPARSDPAPAPSYEWREPADHDPDCRLLYDASAGRQVGGYRYSTGEYRPLLSTVLAGDTQGFGRPCDPPIPPPAGAVNYGVDQSQIRPGKRTINGREVTEAEERAALTPADPPLPDDSGKLHLTLVGTADECKKVMNDILTLPELADLRAKVLLQEYRPDEWAVRPHKFYAGGHPDIVLEDRDGVVLGREHAYEGPEALRKIDPSYDPSKDPDPTHPPAPALPVASPASPVVWLVAGGVLLLLTVLNLKKGK